MIKMITLSQRQLLTQSQRSKISAFIGLSHLEMEVLLEQAKEKIEQFYEKNDRKDHNGNYFRTPSFTEGCKKVKDTIPQQMYLDNPQILVSQENGSYQTAFNQDLKKRVDQRLREFKNPEGRKSLEDMFTKSLSKEKKWMEETQQAIVKYICELQSDYLESGNPMDLKDITRIKIAKHFGYNDSTVSRLVKNLSLKLPDGRVIFADELIPAENTDRIKGVYALEQIMQNPKYFAESKWKLSDERLRPVLKEKFGLDMARRTINKYRNRLEKTNSSSQETKHDSFDYNFF
jgi:DNA-directed RNA polymerase specialized sigma54-like protein